MQPVNRLLSKKELETLVVFLNKIDKAKQSNWQRGIWLWNIQNYEFKKYHGWKWQPLYKWMDEEVAIPDYNKLNENYKKDKSRFFVD